MYNNAFSDAYRIAHGVAYGGLHPFTEGLAAEVGGMAAFGAAIPPIWWATKKTSAGVVNLFRNKNNKVSWTPKPLKETWAAGKAANLEMTKKGVLASYGRTPSAEIINKTIARAGVAEKMSYGFKGAIGAAPGTKGVLATSKAFGSYMAGSGKVLPRIAKFAKSNALTAVLMTGVTVGINEYSINNNKEYDEMIDKNGRKIGHELRDTDKYNGRVEAVASTAGFIAGTAVGAKIGAAAGAAIGSVVPVLGTAVGAVVGLAIGALGGWLASKATKKILNSETSALDKHKEKMAVWKGEEKNNLKGEKRVAAIETTVAELDEVAKANPEKQAEIAAVKERLIADYKKTTEKIEKESKPAKTYVASTSEYSNPLRELLNSKKNNNTQTFGAKYNYNNQFPTFNNPYGFGFNNQFAAYKPFDFNNNKNNLLNYNPFMFNNMRYA